MKGLWPVDGGSLRDWRDAPDNTGATLSHLVAILPSLPSHLCKFTSAVNPICAISSPFPLAAEKNLNESCWFSPWEYFSIKTLPCVARCYAKQTAAIFVKTWLPGRQDGKTGGNLWSYPPDNPVIFTTSQGYACIQVSEWTQPCMATYPVYWAANRIWLEGSGSRDKMGLSVRSTGLFAQLSSIVLIQAMTTPPHQTFLTNTHNKPQTQQL